MAMRLIGITDPWLSAYPEDTVMAYRNPASGVWPDFFTSNDLQALIQTWGAEVSNLTKQWLGPMSALSRFKMTWRAVCR